MPRITNDTFEANTASTTGSLDGEYLWSNPGNWSTGALPFGGNNVTLGADGVDDLGSLSLTSITEAPGAELFYIAGSSLTVGTLAVNANGELYAGILGVSTPVTVSVSSLVGSGSILGAVGGTFIDLSTSDPGEHYFAGYGGAVTLHAAPASSSILEFGGGYTDTIALEALPTGVYSAELEGLAVGDVLELPGSAVEGISFGASSVTITTNLGATTFANAGYGNSVSGYIAAHNNANGMEAVTLTGPDVFTGGYFSTVGSIGVIQLWSTPYNWQSGAPPVSGGSVVLDADGVDDLGSLSLTSITEAPGAELFYIAGSSLTVGTLAVNANGELYAGILGVATPVTVSVSSLVGSGSILGAVGGTFIDLSTSDPGEHYFAGYGGAVTLHAAPASSSILEFGGGYTDTIALEALPTGVYSAELEGLAVGDVLELPGSAVEGISFGASSLAITTSAGIFDFSNVQYDNSVSGYIATHNNANGLEAVTFTDVTCYVAGTKVMTSHGERTVESLQIGDRLKTLHSGYQKIKWIGTRSYGGRFIAGNKAALPICIKQHAFADNVPIRDLFVSPGHAICIAGALVHAARLVNGVSVAQAERVESVTYYHIEMENHEIIFAENCPAETFMGEGFRQRFQNAAEFARVYPGAAATEISCLKRLDSGFQLHAIQRRIAARAGVELPDIAGPGKLRGYVDQAGPNFCTGWAQEILAPEAPVCLDIMAAGRRVGRVLANGHRADLATAGFGSGDHGFEFILPAGTTGRIEAVRISDRSELARTDDAAAQAA